MWLCMGRRLRQNDTNISEIYIGCATYISDVQYIYPTSDILYPTSARARASVTDLVFSLFFWLVFPGPTPTDEA